MRDWIRTMLTDYATRAMLKTKLFVSVINPWLGIVNLFQTFEDLESVKDKQADIQAVREVLDESAADNSAEAKSC